MIMPVQIRVLEPAVYIYCQNPLVEDLGPLKHLMLWGGQIRHTENLGRESHAFLLHIIQHYHKLPSLVLFSQDEPEERTMRLRIEVSFPIQISTCTMLICASPCKALT